MGSEKSVVIIGSFVGGMVGGVLAVSAWRLLENPSRRWRNVARRRRKAIQAGSPELGKMVAGEPYHPADDGLSAMLQAAHELCSEYNSRFRSEAERLEMLRCLLGGSGPDVAPPYVEAPFHCDYGFNITVGANFYANFGCVFLDCATISIGDNAFLAPGVQLYTAAHPVDAEARRREEFAKPIRIGDDVWLGGKVIVCPGVTIGNRVVVGAGAVVVKDVPDDVVVAGVPARAVSSEGFLLGELQVQVERSAVS